jgi:hypothetical protein
MLVFILADLAFFDNVWPSNENASYMVENKNALFSLPKGHFWTKFRDESIIAGVNFSQTGPQ